MTVTTVTKFVLSPLPLYSPHAAKGGAQRAVPPAPLFRVYKQGGAASRTRITRCPAGE